MIRMNNISFYKGAFPAQYGGRLSSVVDITMKEGNTKKLAVSAGIGMVASKVTIEGPIKNKASFIVSGRYSYAGQTLNLLAGKLGSELMNIRGCSSSAAPQRLGCGSGSSRTG